MVIVIDLWLAVVGLVVGALATGIAIGFSLGRRRAAALPPARVYVLPEAMSADLLDRSDSDELAAFWAAPVNAQPQPVTSEQCGHVACFSTRLCRFPGEALPLPLPPPPDTEADLQRMQQRPPPAPRSLPTDGIPRERPAPTSIPSAGVRRDDWPSMMPAECEAAGHPIPRLRWPWTRAGARCPCRMVRAS